MSLYLCWLLDTTAKYRTNIRWQQIQAYNSIKSRKGHQKHTCKVWIQEKSRYKSNSKHKYTYSSLSVCIWKFIFTFSTVSNIPWNVLIIIIWPELISASARLQQVKTEVSVTFWYWLCKVSPQHLRDSIIVISTFVILILMTDSWWLHITTRQYRLQTRPPVLPPGKLL